MKRKIAVRPYVRTDSRTGKRVTVDESERTVDAGNATSTVTVASDAYTNDPFARQATSRDLQSVREQVTDNAERVAQMGDWPSHVSPDSLVKRVPDPDGSPGPGFDAGVACSLDMIPQDRQTLAAKLHAAYTPDAIQQVRDEMGMETGGEPDPDSEAVWWLSACSVCREGEVDADSFMEQLDEFDTLRDDPQKRVEAAKWMLNDMLDAYEMDDNVPKAKRDGGMQGAYLDGHEVAVHHAESYGIWFVGTPTESLGVENFEWKHPPNPDGETRDEQMGRSGPVFGSRQFVKAADREEMMRVVETARGSGLT